MKANAINPLTCSVATLCVAVAVVIDLTLVLVHASRFVVVQVDFLVAGRADAGEGAALHHAGAVYTARFFTLDAGIVILKYN